MKQSTHKLLRRRLLERAGIFEPVERKLYDSLRNSEWSADFEDRMRNRLIMGALRYGLIGKPGKPKYDRIKSIIKRLDIYRTTGNLETLVDVANLCLLEYVEGVHPLRHFHAEDDKNHVTIS